MISLKKGEMTPTHVARPNKCRDQLSTSHPTTQIQTSLLIAIWLSRAITIMALILRSWNSRPWDVDLSNRIDGCVRNQKSYLKYMPYLMTEALGNPNNAYIINHAMSPRNTNHPKSTRDSCDLILASKLSRDQDAGRQMLYDLPTWKDTSKYAT